MQAVGYYLIYPFLWLLSRLPFAILYLISDAVSAILYHWVKYRRDVIRHNLALAFPDLTEKEYDRLARENLRHFCDMFIEMMKSMDMSKKAMRKRFTCDNVDEVNAFAKAEKSTIVLLGHQASYEWIMVLSDRMSQPGYAVYKPLKNRYFDQLIRKIRKKFGTGMVGMKNVRSLIQEVQREPNFFAFIADQAPKPSSARYFTEFFGKATPVFMGAEQLAKRNDMHVFYLHVEKVKRGYYHSRFELITDDAPQTPDWMITDRFFDLLERDIKLQPAYYLWSHKRWKSTLENTKRNVQLSPRVQQ